MACCDGTSENDNTLAPPGGSGIHPINVRFIVCLDLFPFQLECGGHEPCVGCPQLCAQFHTLRNFIVRQLSCNRHGYI